MGLLRLQFRRLRSERLPALAVALLVFVTALLLTAGPRLFEQLSNESLTTELHTAPPAERSIIISELSRTSGDVPDTAADAAGRLATVGEQLPADITPLVADQRVVADSTLWGVESGAAVDSLMYLRVQPGIDEHVELVEGRLPTGHMGYIPSEIITGQPTAVYEGMLSAPAAEAMGVSVGSTVALRLSGFDPRNRGTGLSARVRIVGTFRAADENDPFWLSDQAVTRYRNHQEGDLTFVEGFAILAPDSYEPLRKASADSALPLAFQWRYYLDVTRIDATRVGDLMAALRRFEAQPPRSGVSDVPSDTKLRSGLLRLLLAHEARWISAAALLGVVGAGALFVAAACLTLVTLLASSGRRRTAALALARGAGGRLTRATLVVEGLLLSLPAALLAVAVAAVVVPNANSVVSGTAAAATVIIATVLLTVTGVPAAGAAAARRGGEAVTPRGARPTVRRLVIEAALVAGAVISALVLRERGFASAGDSTLGADPLMVAVPALVGLAAGVLALRLYPLLSGLVAVVTGWRRGIVLALASRRAARGRGSSTVLLTLIATASVAGFAIASWTTIEGAAQVIGWQKVGAQFRVSALEGDIPTTFDAAAIPGVSAVAPVWMHIGYNEATRNTIVVIDAANYDAMTRGTPLERFLPPEMVASLGPTDDTIPVLATTQNHMRPGETTKLSILGRDVRVRVLAQLTKFLTLEPPDNFVIMSYSHLAQVSPPLASGPPRMLFIDGTPSALAGLSAAVGGQEILELQSQQVVAATLSQTPVGQTVSFGLAAAALAAAAYAAVAVAAAFVLAAADQRAETAYLHVLGLARGQRLRLVFAEHVPATLVAAVLGGLLGVALFSFVRPGLGLPTIVPQAAVADPSLDASQIAALLAATLLIVLPAWVLAAVAQREPNLAAAVREGGT